MAQQMRHDTIQPKEIHLLSLHTAQKKNYLGFANRHAQVRLTNGHWLCVPLTSVLPWARCSAAIQWPPSPPCCKLRDIRFDLKLFEQKCHSLQKRTPLFTHATPQATTFPSQCSALRTRLHCWRKLCLNVLGVFRNNWSLSLASSEQFFGSPQLLLQ